MLFRKRAYFTKKIPENYVIITSGLGESTPSCLLLVPLKVEDNVLGIIELASFKVLPKYRIEFVEKIAENIGNAIANLQMQTRTKILLELSQQQTEKMRAQEEEMRQNMEELEATQEEMTRKDLEMRSMLAVTNITLATIEFDMNGYILTTNQFFWI
jgi:GAF domain-containing protein